MRTRLRSSGDSSSITSRIPDTILSVCCNGSADAQALQTEHRRLVATKLHKSLKPLGAVVLEIKPGPYEPLLDKEFANWGPSEDDPVARSFVARLEVAAVGARV